MAIKKSAKVYSIPLASPGRRARKKPCLAWDLSMAIMMKRANPNANGRVRNPMRRARLPKNSMNSPSAPMGVGMCCLSRQLARCAFSPRPPCQPKICCVECKKNVTARPRRRKTNEYDADVSKIQAMRHLVLQLLIGFRDYHITRPKQNHKSLLSMTASCWARRTRRFSKAKIIRSVAIPSPTPLSSFIIHLGSSDTPNHKRSIYHREALYSLVLQRDLITQRVELKEAWSMQNRYYVG